MANFIVCTLFLLLPTIVLSQTQSDEIRTCYRTIAQCNAGTSDGRLIAPAIECCNGGFPYFNFGADGCFACIVIGFRNTSLMLGPADAGQTFSLEVSVLANPTGASEGGIDLTIRPDDVPDNINSYLSSGTGNTPVRSLPFTLNVRVANSGNQIALSPTIQFNYTIMPRDASTFPPGLTEWVFTRSLVTVQDIDVMRIWLGVTTDVEGGVVTATVNRDTISPEVPFMVTIRPEPFTGRLTNIDEHLVLPTDINNFTQVLSYTFRAGSGVTSVPLSFDLPDDDIVELTEVFQLRMTVNDSRVIFRNAFNNEPFVVEKVSFADVDVFNIGFKDTVFTIPEGARQKLVISEKDSVRGGVDIGGYPASRFLPATIQSVPPDNRPATNGSDFILNTTVPNFSYRPNNTLNVISFYPITTFEDALLEGDEVIRIKLAVNSASFQIKEERFQTATVTIRDTTAGSLSLKASSVSVIENQGTVDVCALITGAVLTIPLNVPAILTPVTAIRGTGAPPGDYVVSTTRPYVFRFAEFNNESCLSIAILNDDIKEDLYETFNVTLGDYGRTDLTNLYISDEPTVVTIQDDDDNDC